MDPQIVLDFIDQTPDAVVVTNAQGGVLWANPAFLALCNAPSEAHLKGRSLAEAFGDAAHAAHQWPQLLSQVRTRGVVGRAELTLSQRGAEPVTVDVSAALLEDGDQEHIGFTLRRAAATGAPVGSSAELALDMGQLAGNVGRMTLEELLGEASRMAEVHFIQAALRTAAGRLDGAAEILRVSTPQLVERMQQLGLPPPPLAGQPGSPAWPN